jgi:hypothetical protein
MVAALTRFAGPLAQQIKRKDCSSSAAEDVAAGKLQLFWRPHAMRKILCTRGIGPDRPARHAARGSPSPLPLPNPDPLGPDCELLENPLEARRSAGVTGTAS